jgi:hypothetical protein
VLCSSQDHLGTGTHDLDHPIFTSVENTDSNLICAPYHCGKMIYTSHSPVNTVMTKQNRYLLLTDIVGPSQVCSVGGVHHRIWQE